MKTEVKKLFLENLTLKIEALVNLEETIDRLFLQFQSERKPELLEKFCPYFAQIWPSSIALSKHLLKYPDRVQGCTVLELGCGLAIPSFVASFLSAKKIIARDFHPQVKEFLDRNFALNPKLNFEFEELDWTQPSSGERKFEVILGSDTLYEKSHPNELAKSIDDLIAPNGVLLLSDPGRPYLNPFLKALKSIHHFEEKLFTYTIEAENKSHDVFIYECRFA